ncbi:hypothetical protein M514_10881 [Trichuris suis]|uniref:Phosphoglycerate mutase family protein n=1 Tax=Trichuris suis TaxID=68888 RepID=A0A085LTE2_9BILA|nr:hypothetical protein M513_10881 [Trichuris suis]KFD69795.1 hypothetical protein M514_10881 [Trichuris suis]KHJ44784.1 phosphoglycerate mutase family protein [Trichuris suis]
MTNLKEIIVLKHADSVDRTYERNWIDFYDYGGQRTMEDALHKIRHFNNVALPLQLPKRRADKDTWLADPPLSVIGTLTAEEVGRRLRTDQFNTVDFGGFVYSSPCLCCIQTADCLLRGLEAQNVKVRIEPSLANWRSQHRFVPPTWVGMNKQSYKEGYCGISNIDQSYEPLMKGSDWKPEETLKQLIERLEKLTKHLMKKHSGKIALLIAHGCIISGIDRCLLPNREDKPRPLSWVRYYREVPRLSSASYKIEGDAWVSQPSVIFSFAHLPNGVCDWKCYA